MPPSMLSSDALVIWMFRIAMKAPIIAANTAIHVVGLARSELADAVTVARGVGLAVAKASLAMTSPR